MARNQPEVGNVAPRQARSDGFETVSEANPMRFVAFYRGEVMEGGNITNVANVLRPKASVKVPASRACPDADKARPDGTPLCNWQGWSYDEAIDKKPPSTCPGKRWDRPVCGKNVVLRNEPERYLHAKRYEFVAKSPQQARFLSTKFPRDTDKADDFTAFDAQRGMTYPGRGMTWRLLLDTQLVPELERANRARPKVVNAGPEGETTETPAPIPQRV